MDQRDLVDIGVSAEDAEKICDIKSQRLYRSTSMSEFLDIAIEMQDAGKGLQKCMVTSAPGKVPEGMTIIKTSTRESVPYIRQVEEIESYMYNGVVGNYQNFIEGIDYVLNVIIKSNDGSIDKELILTLKEVVNEESSPGMFMPTTHTRKVSILF